MSKVDIKELEELKKKMEMLEQELKSKGIDSQSAIGALSPETRQKVEELKKIRQIVKKVPKGSVNLTDLVPPKEVVFLGTDEGKETEKIETFEHYVKIKGELKDGAIVTCPKNYESIYTKDNIKKETKVGCKLKKVDREEGF